MHQPKLVFIDRESFSAEPDPLRLSDQCQYQEYGVSDFSNLAVRVAKAEVIVTTRTALPKDILMHAQHLRMIIATAVGTNHIDVDYCQAHQIEVRNCPDYSTQTVAQHTLSMVLALSRSLLPYDQWTKAGHWSQDLFCVRTGLPITDIHQKTWGLIGFGNIGQRVEQLARSFGCKTQYTSTSGKNTQQDCQRVDLETLFASSQIISIHCPLNEQTKNMIDQSILQHIQPDTILINVARGAVMVETDLIAAFQQKNLYLGLDVQTKEPLQETSPIFSIKDSPRVILTPHVAWASKEAKNKLAEMVKAHLASLVII
ncbi:MAG: hydroxyacid dehydrogenase [Deltaproteobacteria bacterium]|nr:hydroxyacid dehydrogenase [Deltaproteobacteria bacterium]